MVRGMLILLIALTIATNVRGDPREFWQRLSQIRLQYRGIFERLDMLLRQLKPNSTRKEIELFKKLRTDLAVDFGYVTDVEKRFVANLPSLHMVIRHMSTEPFHLKVNGKWLYIDETTLAKHPGGIAMTAYSGADATTAFHIFHGGSKLAYQMLEGVPASGGDYEPFTAQKKSSERVFVSDDKVIGHWNLDAQRTATINKNFDRFRSKVRNLGLFEASNIFYFRKISEAIGLLFLAVFLQIQQCFILSALLLGLTWQQLGWLVHEYAHHQHFKNHYWNDLLSYVVGNLLQGFSSGGWKEQHNLHHAATNVIGRDSDIDLMPFWAVVPSNLHEAQKNWLSKVIPYQHIYWSFGFPFLRISWLVQSISFAVNMSKSHFEIHRKRATVERLGLLMHWSLVLTQLYYLPTFKIRLLYFLVSQLFGGFLLAHVVTYNHYSTQKFEHDDPILKSYVCLQLHTTRNMRPGILTDWLWGGLNYQIEHHLFPSMPRHHLKTVMPLVKEFCAENELPYMVNGYFEGWRMEIQQLAAVAKLARSKQTSHRQKKRIGKRKE